MFSHLEFHVIIDLHFFLNCAFTLPKQEKGRVSQATSKHQKPKQSKSGSWWSTLRRRRKGKKLGFCVALGYLENMTIEIVIFENSSFV